MGRLEGQDYLHGLQRVGVAHPSRLLLLGEEARRWGRACRDRGDWGRALLGGPHMAPSREAPH